LLRRSKLMLSARQIQPIRIVSRVALALRPGENPDLDSDTGLYHFIYERPAPYVGPCYEEMT